MRRKLVFFTGQSYKCIFVYIHESKNVYYMHDTSTCDIRKRSAQVFEKACTSI